MSEMTSVPVTPEKPHMEKALIEIWPKAHRIYLRYKLPIQVLVTVAVIVAGWQNCQLASAIHDFAETLGIGGIVPVICQATELVSAAAASG